jgi:hypothetical protein
LFATQPAFHFPFSESFAMPGCELWHAVTLPLQTPWYIFTYGDEDIPFVQTSFAGGATTLIELIEAVPVEDRKSIARMSREPEGDDRWTMRWLEAVWLPSPGEEEGSILVIKPEGEDSLYDEHMRPVDPAVKRKLLFRAAARPLRT